MMKTLAFGAILAGLLVGAAHAQTVGGAYTVAGTNPSGSTYTGTAEITPSGSTCRIVWHTGSVTSQGVCMVSNKAVAAFYKLGADFGLVVYELQPDGVLTGYWSIVDKEGVGGEILTPKR
jgi:hypothetical protein